MTTDAQQQLAEDLRSLGMTSERDPDAEILALAVVSAFQAGSPVMEIYSRPDVGVETKADQSPVTLADKAAEEEILARLDRDGRWPVVAEERVTAEGLPEIGTSFWLVDPLDGTKEFISRNGEFTINVAWIDASQPRIGAVFAPARQSLYFGNDQAGARWASVHAASSISGVVSGSQPIACRKAPDNLTVVTSRSHRSSALDEFLRDYQVDTCVPAGSSLKLCLLAHGQADLYPRLGRTMEWDIAAGDAVLRAAGGSLQTLDGESMTYGKPGCENPAFVARGLS